MAHYLTPFAKLVLHRLFCTACGAGMIYVAVSTFVGMEPGEFWGL